MALNLWVPPAVLQNLLSSVVWARSLLAAHWHGAAADRPWMVRPATRAPSAAESARGIVCFLATPIAHVRRSTSGIRCSASEERQHCETVFLVRRRESYSCGTACSRCESYTSSPFSASRRVALSSPSLRLLAAPTQAFWDRAGFQSLDYTRTYPCIKTATQPQAQLKTATGQRDDGHRPSNHGRRSWLDCRECG